MKSLFKNISNDIYTIISLHQLFNEIPELMSLGIKGTVYYDDDVMLAQVEKCVINSTEYDFADGFEQDILDKNPEWFEQIENFMFTEAANICYIDTGREDGEVYAIFTREDFDKSQELIEAIKKCQQILKEF